jgi:hypothetical protein
VIVFLVKLLLGKHDLFRKEEILLIADAVEAMTFTVVRNHNVRDLSFQGRLVMRLDTVARALFFVGNSGTPEEVYRFRWWRPRDQILFARLKVAMLFYDRTVHRLRMQDYRTLFGNQVQICIGRLADLAEKAEAEARQLAAIDGDQGSRRYHQEIERMVRPPSDEPPQEPDDG